MKRKGRLAFTVLELMVVVAILAILGLFLLASLARAKAKAPQINCVNNLKSVGLGFRMWSNDNGEKYPAEVSTSEGGVMELVHRGEAFRNFQALSNELNTPKVVVCPFDSARSFATNFGPGFNNSNVSYFVGLVDSSDTNAFLAGDRHLIGGSKVGPGLLVLTLNDTVKWDGSQHEGFGNIAFVDGSVQELSSKDLVKRLKENGVATNLLAIP